MTQLQGLKNFAVNIKPTMLKIKDGKRIHPDELQNVLQFYLEVLDYLNNTHSLFSNSPKES